MLSRVWQRQARHTSSGIVVRDFAHNNAKTCVTKLLLQSASESWAQCLSYLFSLLSFLLCLLYILSSLLCLLSSLFSPLLSHLLPSLLSRVSSLLSLVSYLFISLSSLFSCLLYPLSGPLGPCWVLDEVGSASQCVNCQS